MVQNTHTLEYKVEKAKPLKILVRPHCIAYILTLLMKDCSELI